MSDTSVNVLGACMVLHHDVIRVLIVPKSGGEMSIW